MLEFIEHHVLHNMTLLQRIRKTKTRYGEGENSNEPLTAHNNDVNVYPTPAQLQRQMDHLTFCKSCKRNVTTVTGLDTCVTLSHVLLDTSQVGSFFAIRLTCL